MPNYHYSKNKSSFVSTKMLMALSQELLLHPNERKMFKMCTLFEKELFRHEKEFIIVQTRHHQELMKFAKFFCSSLSR